MDSFIKCPNLPINNVSLGLIDGRADNSIISELKCNGIDVITTDSCEDLYDAVAGHPDMFIVHAGGNIIISAPNAPLNTIDKLIENGFHIIKGQKAIMSKYPENIAYNVARIENYAICNVKYTDKVLLKYLYENDIKLIDINQGYAKCSLCIAGRGVIITSDEGVYRTLAKHDFDILKISQGNIELKGLNYGFIGGSSGLISNKTLAFTGDIKKHPDFPKIDKFLGQRGIKIKILGAQKLTDVGTFIPLKEYCI